MSRFRVVIQLRAEAATLAAFAWIAGRSPEAAAPWLAGLRKALDQLADAPTVR